MLVGWRDAAGIEGGMLEGWREGSWRIEEGCCWDGGGMLEGCSGQKALTADSGVSHYLLQHSLDAPTSCVQVKG